MISAAPRPSASGKTVLNVLPSLRGAADTTVDVHRDTICQAATDIHPSGHRPSASPPLTSNHRPVRPVTGHHATIVAGQTVDPMPSIPLPVPTEHRNALWPGVAAHRNAECALRKRGVRGGGFDCG